MKARAVLGERNAKQKGGYERGGRPALVPRLLSLANCTGRELAPKRTLDLEVGK